MKEILQICITYVFRFLTRLLFIFPIKKNRISFVAYGGRSFTCNPKYIYNQFIKDDNDKYQLVWHFDNINSKDFTGLKDDTQKIKLMTLKSLYYFATSKVIITNFSMIKRPPVRKNQIYINTWHGGGAYKKVGVTNITKDKKRTDITFDLLAKDTTYVISSCEKFTENYIPTMRMPKEKFLEIGMPRNDIFFTDYTEITNKVRNFYHINDDTKILLFAPTYRGGERNKQTDLIEIDIQNAMNSLSMKFNSKFICLYRGHYYVQNKQSLENTLNVSDYPDMQELLCAADVLITDYSSSIWDFSLTKKPCFLFTSDLNEYSSDREFYVPIDKWGFSYAKTNEELSLKIKDFDEKEYQKKLEEMYSYFGSFENGSACKKIFELIESDVI